jgi:hypothetical protein
VALNQNRPEIVDVGSSGASDDALAERLKKTVCIVLVESDGWSESDRLGGGQRVRRPVGAGDFFDPINAIGVASQRVDAGLGAQGNSKGE